MRLTNRQRLIWVSLQTNSRKAIRKQQRDWSGNLKPYYPRRALTLRLSKQFGITEGQAWEDLYQLRKYFTVDY